MQREKVGRRKMGKVEKKYKVCGVTCVMILKRGFEFICVHKDGSSQALSLYFLFFQLVFLLAICAYKKHSVRRTSEFNTMYC